MTRKKVKLAWIANNYARKSTFMKRKKGLMKKVSELSTLCGVEACAIVYGPYAPGEPDVWPSPSDAHRVLTRFKSMPVMEQSKKMLNQEAFFRERISKTKEQLRKQQRENREFEITQIMYRNLVDISGRILLDVQTDELRDLAFIIEEKMNGIKERIDSLKSMTSSPSQLNNGTGVQRAVEMEAAAQRQTWSMTQMMNNLPPHQEQQPTGNYGGNEFANGLPFAENAPWSN